MNWGFLKAETLETACLQQGLILIETLQSWRQEDARKSFPSLVLKHLSAFDDLRWMEMISNQPGLPEIYPLGSILHPVRTLLSRSSRWMEEEFAVILLDEPLLVIGLLDPFHSSEIARQIELHFPARPYVLVSLTPMDFGRVLSHLDSPGPRIAREFEEDLNEWCRCLDFDPNSFRSLDDLIEELWRRGPPFPAVIPGSHTSAEIIPTEPLCLLLRKTATQAWIACLQPNDEALLDRLYQKLGRRIHLLAMGPKEFTGLYQQANSTARRVSQYSCEFTNRLVRDWHLEAGPAFNESQLLQSLLEAAIRRRASDIHLEPKEDHLQVRYRIDGELVIQAPLPKNLYPLLLRRVKILSGMRHELSGVIQDGALTHVFDQIRHDCRTSITILQGGEEALVIRLFSSQIPSLEELRFPPREMQILQDVLQQENGLILVTGPTGSGKTTTLYACLQALSDPTRSIVTIEQPVERHLSVAKQLHIGSVDLPSALTFSSALRSLLRQDPDIMMIGEIRDPESAQIAVQASLSGHLVLSTIHANDSVGVIERLCGSFGVDRLGLAYTLKLAIAQRLLPRLCPECRRSRAPTPRELGGLPKIEIDNPVIAERVGCPACLGTGRAGRIPILEMLPVDEETTSLLEQRASPRELREHNHRRGFTSLKHQITALALGGEIELREARSFQS